MLSSIRRPVPQVTGISPKEGPPGTRVTIRGQDLGLDARDLIGEFFSSSLHHQSSNMPSRNTLLQLCVSVVWIASYLLNGSRPIKLLLALDKPKAWEKSWWSHGQEALALPLFNSEDTTFRLVEPFVQFIVF